MVAYSYPLTLQIGKLRLRENCKYLTKGHTFVSSKDSDFLAPTPVLTFASGKASPVATILETLLRRPPKYHLEDKREGHTEFPQNATRRTRMNSHSSVMKAFY